METFYSLFEMWIKSLKFLARKTVQILFIIFLLLIFNKLLYMIFFKNNFSQESIINAELFEKFKILLISLVSIAFNQTILVLCLTFLWLHKEKNIFKDFRFFKSFIKERTINLLLAIMFKVLIIGVCAIFLFIPGIIAATLMALMEFFVIIEKKSVITSIYLSYKIIKKFFWSITSFYCLFHLLPLFLLRDPILNQLMQSLSVINMFILYIKYYKINE